MHPDLLNILANTDQPIDNEQLIAYLTGKLSPAESQQVEAQLSAAGIDAEALEGLMMVQDRKRLPAIQHELDMFLKAQTSQPNKRKHKTMQVNWLWLSLATLLLIALAVLAWYAVHFLQGK